MNKILLPQEDEVRRRKNFKIKIKNEKREIFASIFSSKKECLTFVKLNVT